MTEQKLRKFKLIDREGYLNSHYLNETFIRDHFTDGIVVGVLDEDGDFEVEGDVVVEYGRGEFQFFEEVFDTPAPVLNKFQLYNEEWVVVAPHPTMENHTIIAETNSNRIDVISDEELENLLIPKTWQEVLCEEYSQFEISSSEGDRLRFLGGMSATGMVELAKRILELSGGH